MLGGVGDCFSVIHNMTACCGYDASQDRIDPVPSEVVWDAWCFVTV
jgi:hypothetical protein